MKYSDFREKMCNFIMHVNSRKLLQLHFLATLAMLDTKIAITRYLVIAST